MRFFWTNFYKKRIKTIQSKKKHDDHQRLQPLRKQARLEAQRCQRNRKKRKLVEKVLEQVSIVQTHQPWNSSSMIWAFGKNVWGKEGHEKQNLQEKRSQGIQLQEGISLEGHQQQQILKEGQELRNWNQGSRLERYRGSLHRRKRRGMSHLKHWGNSSYQPVIISTSYYFNKFSY